MQGKTLKELWEENGKKFPFKAKYIGDKKDWWETYYKEYKDTGINITGLSDVECYYKCPDNKYGHKISNYNGEWILVPEKEIVGTLEDFRAQGILPPYTVEFYNKRKNEKFLMEVIEFVPGDISYYKAFDLEDLRFKTLCGTIVELKLLKGED